MKTFKLQGNEFETCLSDLHQNDEIALEASGDYFAVSVQCH
jgi:hypothetical protein